MTTLFIFGGSQYEAADFITLLGFVCRRPVSMARIEN